MILDQFSSGKVEDNEMMRLATLGLSFMDFSGGVLCSYCCKGVEVVNYMYYSITAAFFKYSVW